MSSMVCTPMQVRGQPMDYYISRNSNTAGAPLPLIPRRFSAVHAHTLSPTSSISAPTTPCRSTKFQARVKVQPPTPPDTVVLPASQKGHFPAGDSETSSSSLSSDVYWPTVSRRPKRIYGQRFPAVCPPEFSTPTPAVLKATKFRPSSSEDARQVEGLPMDSDDDETPRPVPQKIQTVSPVQLPGLHFLHLSSHIDPSTPSLQPDSSPVQIPPSVEAKLVRKKSGQPVKSSLKSVKQAARGGLSVFTQGMSSKSEPNTPTHAKAVHFDSQLEHVKLFLAEQKPLAVSRDGSPTDDTSGTDTDFPSFIFGASDGMTRRNLVMDLTNMPPTINTNADVALEELRLSPGDASILGSVRVRNIAFQKWLAVRFTFDLWQTTSEVTAKYAESLDKGTFDRFTFTIRLNDMLPRIEGKTLILALRYTVVGREMWDNNGGRDYLANFTKSKSIADKAQSSETGPSATGSDIADLKSQLERVVQDGEGGQRSRRNALIQEEDKVLAFKDGNSLASRYDFAASLKNPWKSSAKTPSPPRHLRTSSYPSSHSPPSSIPWPVKNPWSQHRGTMGLPSIPKDPSFGSPRDPDEDRSRSAVYVCSDSEELSCSSFSQAREGRHHQRGYFSQGLSEASGVKKTPAGTPLLTPTRFYSFPPVDSDSSLPCQGMLTTPTRSIPQLMSMHSDAGSADSTPSIISPSSSRSTSPSSTELSLPDHAASPVDCVDEPLNASPSTEYHQFLNRFCFFTGNDALLDTPAEAISRSHSASSVEGFLLTQSPGFLSPFMTPTRTPSYDDVISRSGSATPTARTFGTFEFPSAATEAT